MQGSRSCTSDTGIYYSLWYVINSHARDSAGMIADQGSSVVLQLPNYMSLLHSNRCLVEHATSERVINQNDLAFEAMTLQVRERKPVSSDENLILLIKSFLTYRASLGVIDLVNTLRNTPTEVLGTSPVQRLAQKVSLSKNSGPTRNINRYPLYSQVEQSE